MGDFDKDLLERIIKVYKRTIEKECIKKDEKEYKDSKEKNNDDKKSYSK